jgi:hypothetical protein
VAVLAVLLLVAVGGLSGAVLSSLRLSRTTEESAKADEAVRALAAEMRLTSFEQIFFAYNTTVQDDVLVGVAPGSAFDVPGLTPRNGDPDGRVGRIVFPSVELPDGSEVLREDFADARMGMAKGMDLNLDGDLLDEFKTGYEFLPVRLVVEWTGAGGNRSYELDLLMVQ